MDTKSSQRERKPANCPIYKYFNGSCFQVVHWTLSGWNSLVRTFNWPSNWMSSKMLRTANSTDFNPIEKLFKNNIQHFHLSINQRGECASRLPITDS